MNMGVFALGLGVVGQEVLEKALEQQADLPHLGFVLDVVLFDDMDCQGPVIVKLP